MGNSLLGILVFGRRQAKTPRRNPRLPKAESLTVNHVTRFHKELKKAGIAPDRHSPMILPDYRREGAKLELEAFAVRGWE